MQNKSAIWMFAILLAVACLYSLSFSFFTGNFEKEAREQAMLQADSVARTMDTNLDDIGSFHHDSLVSYYEARYTELKGNDPVYPLLGYSYNDCKAKELNQGLDLEGGMSVTLELSIPEMIKGMAGNPRDPNFQSAINLAREAQKTETSDFITLFEKAWNENFPGQPLINVFHSLDTKEKFPIDMTNEQVIQTLKDEAKVAINNTENILRARIDKFGVTQPTIQKQQFSGRILVELPGVKDKDRVRKILKSTANLEFWHAYQNREFGPKLGQANDELSKVLHPELFVETNQDSTQTDQTEDLVEKADGEDETNVDELVETDSANAELADIDTTFDDPFSEPLDTLSEAEQRKRNPIFSLLQPSIQGVPGGGAQWAPTVAIGYANVTDTAAITKLLHRKEIAHIFPSKNLFKFLWGAEVTNGNVSLYAIKISSRDGKPLLSGGSIVDARQDFDQVGGVMVSMTMDSDGAKTWERMTQDADNEDPTGGDNNGYIAIVLDELVYSAPQVRQKISGGRSTITVGAGTRAEQIEEATDLSNLLKAGALPAPADIVDEQIVGPSLGKENIRKGLFSFAIALGVVLVFMILFYKGAGWVSDIALIANLFFLIGALASLQAALTLPGIAGIILTIGMSVDANVLIFERIKEEMNAGAGVQAAIKKGYQKAYSAIIDANITTLLTAIVLAYFGSGPIRGFATTLIIGIFTSLFAAIFITRLIFTWRLENKKGISFYWSYTKTWLADTQIEFVKNRKIFYVLSAIVVGMSLVSLLGLRGLDFGVDFAGGRTYEVEFNEPVKSEDVRNELGAVFITEDGRSLVPEVKQIGTSGRRVKITTKYLIDDKGEEVDQKVDDVLFKGLANIGQFDRDSIESKKVDPTISDDFQNKSMLAVLFSLIIIFFYIAVRFKRWQFGAGALVALAHDVIIVLGLFSFGYGILPFSLEIDQAFIAAILTVVGYSINDTVVVFDRIREYLSEHRKDETKVIINTALNATLSRTVNTSASTFVVLLMIFIFGSDSIRGFAFALMAGIVVGTYSSIFIATPVVVDLTKKFGLSEAPAKK